VTGKRQFNLAHKPHKVKKKQKKCKTSKNYHFFTTNMGEKALAPPL